MPVTNYHSVNGRILGETTAGVRTDYLTDALGSVTATVNSSGAVVNRYRYKPYGALLSKTGVGADPKQQWVGSQGYRQTGKKYSDVYVRARHYDTANGRWATKDPIGFRGGDWNVYRYSLCRITLAVDPTGLECPTCGPELSGQVGLAVKKIRDQFSKWNNGQKHAGCYALISLDMGPIAWDINDLKTYPWRHKPNPPCPPPCSTGGRCEDSVSINGTCFFAGSVNYVAFGAMMNLCNRWAPWPTSLKWDEAVMSAAVLYQKQKGNAPGDVALCSLSWAKAGWNGWPSVPSPTVCQGYDYSDRAECDVTKCTCLYHGPRFKVRWLPFGDY